MTQRSETALRFLDGRNITPLLLRYERERAEQLAAEKVCICPSHASHRGECPVHDEKGRVRQTVTKSADLPITGERPRDVGAPGAAT